ncbi:MAG: SLC13 family permease [Pseudomonadota bacterium]|nr:SLC13 family permease [Pseudomonadota bacterium]
MTAGSSTLVLLVFTAVYLGMALGRVPGLVLDRTGVALLGLIVLLASGALTLAEAGAATDLPTLALLFALMIVSAQFQGSGFYSLCAGAVTRAAASPTRLLALLVAVTGVLSALLTNDVVVFAMTPLVCAGLTARGLDPRPYLVALAGAANAGSAATLIGNPQNILIGQKGGLDFWTYALWAAPVAALSLAVVFVCVRLTWSKSLAQTVLPPPRQSAIAIDRFQIAKGVAGLLLLIVLFATDLPREIGALAVAGLLLLSRRMSSRDMIGSVDWHLLLLFVCLFGVTAAFAATGLAGEAIGWMAASGLSPDRLAVLAPATLALSNSIGNVPAVVLMLALLPQLGEGAMVALAVLSTLAGNLLLTGSMCNIIVAERAQASGARLGFADFARSGIPMTLVSMALACLFLWAAGVVRL